MTDVKLIDKLVSFEDDPDGLLVKQSQEIPDDWLSALKRKIMPTKTASGEYEKLFIIPTGVLDVWTQKGFDWMNADDAEIARKLRSEGLDAFIVGRI